MSTLPQLSHTLSESLAKTGWTDRLRSLSLELLRNGSCDTFPQLFAEVLRRAKLPKPTDMENGAARATNGTSTPASNGANGMNKDGGISVRPGWFGEDGLPDVRIPAEAVEAGVEFLKEKIRDVVEVVDSEDES